jgi:DNA-binding response OmpR family regulator
VVVRLELPDDGTRPTTPISHAEREPALNPARLARAVEDLIRAIDPSLASARVEVEVTHAGLEQDEELYDEELEADDGDPEAYPARPTRASYQPLTSGRRPDLGLDLAGRTLSVDGRIVTLTRREFDLLAYLEDHRGVALSREELMKTVWQTGYLVGDRTIDVHVRRLRVKLGRYANQLSTLRGYGYRLD